MGFKEVVKKLGLGDLINLFKIEIDNSKHIEIKDSTFIIDNRTTGHFEYTLPNTIEYDQVRDHIKKLFKPNVSGFVRTDLALPEIGMISARKENKDTFNYYKNRIKPEHYRAMIASFTIMEFEDRGDFVTSNKLFYNLIKKYGSEGRHIYNFCRSGLMGGFFWNELGFIIVEGATENIVREKFSKTFDNYVKFYSYAVWVAPPMDFDDIVDELRVRLNVPDVQRVDIYFRGKEKMGLCEEIIELLDQKDSLKIECIERYSICNSPCKHISLAKVHDKFKTF